MGNKFFGWWVALAKCFGVRSLQNVDHWLSVVCPDQERLKLDVAHRIIRLSVKVHLTELDWVVWVEFKNLIFVSCLRYAFWRIRWNFKHIFVFLVLSWVHLSKELVIERGTRFIIFWPIPLLVSTHWWLSSNTRFIWLILDKEFSLWVDIGYKPGRVDSCFEPEVLLVLFWILILEILEYVESSFEFTLVVQLHIVIDLRVEYLQLDADIVV